MGRKNKRVIDDTWISPIKDEKRPALKCHRFPNKTVFTTGYRAQVSIDDLKAISDRQKVPQRVYECFIDEGGCGYFHTTSQDEK